MSGDTAHPAIARQGESKKSLSTDRDAKEREPGRFQLFLRPVSPEYKFALVRPQWSHTPGNLPYTLVEDPQYWICKLQAKEALAVASHDRDNGKNLREAAA